MPPFTNLCIALLNVNKIYSSVNCMFAFDTQLNMITEIKFQNVEPSISHKIYDTLATQRFARLQCPLAKAYSGSRSLTIAKTESAAALRRAKDCPRYVASIRDG